MLCSIESLTYFWFLHYHFPGRHHFLHQDPSLSRQQAIINTMSEIGPSVLSGCLTTFTGILPLVFAKSSIFRIFFKMFVWIGPQHNFADQSSVKSYHILPICARFFNIIVYATIHGLVLTPVLLSIIPFTSPNAAIQTSSQKSMRDETAKACQELGPITPMRPETSAKHKLAEDISPQVLGIFGQSHLP